MKPAVFSSILLSTVLAFLACSGGGSASGTASTPPSAPPQDPAGIWVGTSTTNGGGIASVIGACDGQGNFRYYAADNSVGAGRLAVTGAAFTGTGTVFTPTMAVLPLSFSSGTLSAATSLTCQWSAGGSSGNLAVTFNPLYNRPVALAALAGTYLGSSTSGSTPELTLHADGTFTGTSAGGAFYGALSALDPAKNLFRVSMTQAGETYTGCAFWADAAISPPLSANTLYVQVSNPSYGLAATLAKQ